MVITIESVIMTRAKVIQELKEKREAKQQQKKEAAKEKRQRQQNQPDKVSGVINYYGELIPFVEPADVNGDFMEFDSKAVFLGIKRYIRPIMKGEPKSSPTSKHILVSEISEGYRLKLPVDLDIKKYDLNSYKA